MKARREAGLFAVLAEVLRELPKLPDPACAGRPELFDPAGEGEPASQVRTRHAAAVAICQGCACLTECRSWAETQRSEGGVVGGQLPVTPGRPKKVA